MPATELENGQEEQDVLNIGDGGSDTNAQQSGSDDADTNIQAGGAEDRGDNFISSSEDEVIGDSAGAEGGPSASGTTEDDGNADRDGRAETDGGGEKGDDGAAPSGDGKIPASRLGEVARAKSAATAIADGLVDGSIDPSVIRDFGGAAAAARAVANREVTIEDLQTGITKFGQENKDNDAKNSPSSWDLDEKYLEYQELVEAGETKAAATMLRQINKEERARERAIETKANEQATLVSFVNEILSKYPVLNDPKSPEHENVMVWANHFQATRGINRIDALEQAIKKVGLSREKASKDEAKQQQVNRQRAEEATKKAVDAQNRQPPPMGLGATPQGTKQIDITKLNDEEFASTPDSVKKMQRGDII